jgi:phosphoribosylaminoimidazolecarboxamide formyltransferase/IMP cyclohydrolase
VAHQLPEAFVKARACDPVSAFGGIVAFNRPVHKDLAAMISETFFEAIIAPQYTDGALEMFKNKKNMRVMCLNDFSLLSDEFDLRKVSGGLLVQDADRNTLSLKDSPVVTKKKPTEEQLVDLEFAWKVVKHVKSNAIVFAKDGQTLGIGAGQMSRVDSVRLAVNKAIETFKDQKILNGAVMASDAFFPFRDGIDVAVEQGISAVVQPGGSVRDTEVIDACNEHGLAMVVTGERHFRH